MEANKVVYDGRVIVDLTSDTVDVEHLAEGYTAHDKSGASIVGTMKQSSGCSVETITSSGDGTTSISFTGLKAQPKMFSVILTSQVTASTAYRVVSILCDGTTTYGTYMRQSSSFLTYAIQYVSASYFTWTYSNGTLTIKTNSSSQGGVFNSGSSYVLSYSY